MLYLPFLPLSIQHVNLLTVFDIVWCFILALVVFTTDCLSLLEGVGCWVSRV